MKNKIFILTCILSIQHTLIQNTTPNQTKIPENFIIEFHDSMSANKGYKKEKAKSDHRWEKLKLLFEEHFLNNPNFSAKPKIPKIIHQIWLGSNGNFPEKYKRFQQTWMDKHPDWEYIFWSEKEIDEFGLKNRKLYDETDNYAAKSDIARYEILYRMGGLYIDTDFECIQEFDILHHLCDFYAGCCMSHVEIMNGLVGVAPEHPIIKECIDKIKPKKKRKEDAMDIIRRTGPLFLTECFFNVTEKHSSSTIVFPMTYFYPVPNDFCKNMPKNLSDWIKPESFAIHHWNFSWKPN